MAEYTNKMLGHTIGRIIASQRFYTMEERKNNAINIITLAGSFNPSTAELILGESGSEALTSLNSFYVGQSYQPISYIDGHLIVEDV